MKTPAYLIKSGWMLIFLLSIGVAGYAVIAYGMRPLGSSVHPEMQAVFRQHRPGIYLHVFASLIALACGPFQFLPGLRERHTKLHRATGRAYLFLGVLPGGMAGLYMAQYAFGGMVSEVGFAMLAVLWLFTAIKAFGAIRRRDVDVHRRWMIRNFSLTFAAVTLRIYLGSFFASGLEFDTFYPLVAWLSWVPNLVFAEWVLVGRQS